jgi:tRNA (pseudouridine54-N1)-methyltransferase
MTIFTVIGHTARTDEQFSLNDLPSSGGRMDLICRAVGSSLFLSHGVRTDTIINLLLLGQPRPGLIIRISGEKVRSLSPDERNIAALLKKAMSIPVGKVFRDAGPGVSIRKGNLAEIINEDPYTVLDESGTDIRTVSSGEIPYAFILSDNLNFSAEEDECLKGLPRYSLGPAVVHADHAIILLLNEIDRRRI